jgi:hypothetical protein
MLHNTSSIVKHKQLIYIEIAKCLNSKVYVTDQKRAMLDCFQDKELNQLLTSQPQDAQVHVIPLWHVLPEVYTIIIIK